MRALRAGAADVFELESAGSDELAQATCCSSPELRFGLAAGVVDLGGVEAYELDVKSLVMNLDGVAVDNLDIGRIDWFSKGWRREEQHSDTG